LGKERFNSKKIMATSNTQIIPGRAEKQLDDADVREMVTKWYQLLDVHAPEVDLLPLLSDAGLEMQFPEGPLHGLDDFKHWYETVTHTFFDEKHVLKEVNVTLSGERADIDIIVNWQARRWRPPLAQSDWIGFDAYQRWKVLLNAGGKPVVINYIVDKLEPMQGSARLEGSVALWPRQT
jgi:hypothetical protein